MSKIYEKSISDKFSNYFEKPSLIKKKFASYDLRSHTISTPTETFPWDSSGGGVPLYYDDSSKKVYLDHTDSHSLIIGPTGSKKTRLVALPTIKNLSVAKESMIISDPKAELYSRPIEANIRWGKKKASDLNTVIYSLFSRLYPRYSWLLLQSTSSRQQ